MENTDIHQLPEVDALPDGFVDSSEPPAPQTPPLTKDDGSRSNGKEGNIAVVNEDFCEGVFTVESKEDTPNNEFHHRHSSTPKEKKSENSETKRKTKKSLLSDKEILELTLKYQCALNDDPPMAVEIEYETTSKLCVGVTVITGYLGAGKSTLINHLINSASGKRIAVILNEFGEEIGVERAMINEGDKGTVIEEWIELANGCVCCTVKHSLVQALEQLVNMNRRLDHILIETTGLANPAPLASILWLDEQLESSVKLDSIVTVVDAKNLSFQLREHRDSSLFPEAVHQIAFADTIILNKIDLVTWKNIEQLEEEIIKINSLAQIIPCMQSKVDINTILERGAYDSEHALHLEKLLKESKSSTNDDVHDSGVRTLCVSEKLELCADKVRQWIEEILWERKNGVHVYRCKGVLNMHGSNEMHILQGVREIYEIVPCRKWREGETRVSKVVFIGYNLGESFLAESFKLCAMAV